MSEDAPVTEALTLAKVLCHVRDPKNLLTYLVFTAWMKFMGVAAHMPSISVG